MKKITSFILILALVLSGSLTVFADDLSKETLPRDVKGTNYEAAVKNLISKEIISGYEDGNFKPENKITRAESCILIVRSMNATDLVLKSAMKSSFNDMQGYDWAKNYINYVTAKGIAKGYGNNTFRPGNNVTYNEMCALLVNALGYKAQDLQGKWPENYRSKADELGIFKGITSDLSQFDTKQPATRGNVALMINSVLESLLKQTDTQTSTDTSKNEPDTDKSPSKAGKLKDYSGYAIGMILSSAKVVNKDKESVQEIEFLFGDDILYLNTNGKCNIDSISFDGTPYTLKINNGVITKINTGGSGLKYYSDLTGGKWIEVAERDGHVITAKDGSKFTIVRDASFYGASFNKKSIDAYEASNLNHISKGTKLRMFDVTDDTNDVANIVVIIDADDANDIAKLTQMTVQK
ncbi:S-layer homology domain-containing protein [Sinanaerobacter sp. ZZT-01]|uniref:S-layer homology domain-containing protein n=1 Tax=Sinanaerobacter sp. ZZT-01 TaxID=3111540 RepID=UPI002D79517A|nr:S-layer homology domain-containing protein [Sinanaerobacter sp. ZZT-01]WRR94880.1 S-layer homology domain-containing protein [Sinanaerobacter sp. ZZT-01]